METESYPTQVELLDSGINGVTIRATYVYEPATDEDDAEWVVQSYVAYGWGLYKRVYRTRKLFLGEFETFDEARVAFPFADVVDAD